MPSGIVSSKFWEMTKSVKEVRPLISSGSLSSLFSETSRQSRFFRFPISCSTAQKEEHTLEAGTAQRNLLWEFFTPKPQVHTTPGAGAEST